jgi:hypothetical protein
VEASLRPCPYRLVDNDGQVLCTQIKSGDRQVTVAICETCPVAEIGCAHLRATLISQHNAPLTVRWGNGQTQVWSDPTPPVSLERAACAAKTIPILSTRDCFGCSLKQPVVLIDKIKVMPKRALTFGPDTDRQIRIRTNTLAQKLLSLQNWLAKKSAARSDEEPGILPPAFVPRSVRSTGEEQRAGWTD